MELGVQERTTRAPRRSIITGAAFAILSFVALAAGVPQFSDYPRVVSTEKVGAIDLKSHPQAPRFRTRLNEAIGKSANFAGHYVVVTWGCGTSCQAVALIEVKSGRVYFAPFSTDLGSDFRADSGLFIGSPPKAIREYFSELGVPIPTNTTYSSYYYVWDDKKTAFQLVHTESPVNTAR